MTRKLKVNKNLDRSEILMLEQLVSLYPAYSLITNVILKTVSQERHDCVQVPGEDISLEFIKQPESDQCYLTSPFLEPDIFYIDIKPRDVKIECINAMTQYIKSSPYYGIIDSGRTFARTEVASTILEDGGVLPSKKFKYDDAPLDAELNYLKSLLFSTISVEISAEYIKKYFDDCQKNNKLGFIKITLITRGDNVGHATMLIFDPKNRIIEYFDPNGYAKTTNNNFIPRRHTIDVAEIERTLRRFFPEYFKSYSFFSLGYSKSESRMGIQVASFLTQNQSLYSAGICGLFSTWFLYQRIFADYKTIEEFHDKFTSHFSEYNEEYLLNFTKKLLINIKIGGEDLQSLLVKKYKENVSDFLYTANSIINYVNSYGDFRWDLSVNVESTIKITYFLEKYVTKTIQTIRRNKDLGVLKM